MKLFRELGELIRQQWKANSYDLKCFSALAATALSDFRLAERVSSEEVIRWAIVADRLPSQADVEGRFGQPPLTLFSGAGFRIELLFWVNGIPTVHEHGFSGAFQLFEGASVHTIWQFQQERRFSQRLLIGRLGVFQTEILHTGEVRPIQSGSAFLHSTFHLHHPTITLVVRTDLEPASTPQLSYYPPSVAHDPEGLQPDTQKRNQLLSLLWGLNRTESFFLHLDTLLANAETVAAYEHLAHAASLLETEEETTRALTLLDRHHPELAIVYASLEQMRIQKKIRSLHRRVTDPNVNLLLAALLHAPEVRETYAHLAKSESSRNAEELLPDSLSALLVTEGVFPEPTRATRLLVKCILGAQTNGNIHETFAAEFGRNETAGSGETLIRLAETLRSHWAVKLLNGYRGARTREANDWRRATDSDNALPDSSPAFAIPAMPAPVG